MKLISPIAHTVHRKFPDPRNPKVFELKVFVFEPGKAVEVPDEYANALEATAPEKYYTEKEWKGYLVAQGLKQEELAEAEGAEIPTLEELKAKDGATLKALADELGIFYAQDSPPKTIALAIFNFLNVRKAIEDIEEGEGSLGDLTVGDLKKKLDELGVGYTANAKKADLVALLEEKVKQTIEE